MSDVPHEKVKLSDMEKKKERVRIIFADKKIPKRVKAGEEEDFVETGGEKPEKKSGNPSEPEEPEHAYHVSEYGNVTSSQLAAAIVRDVRPVASCIIFISDGIYSLYPTSQIRKVVDEDLTDLQLWTNQYFDCDDFAQVVFGVVGNILRGSAFGMIWYSDGGFYHAVNCFYSLEEKKIKLLEPQTDRIYDFDRRRYKTRFIMI